jgi:glycosyltransferase-like protein LARGE
VIHIGFVCAGYKSSRSVVTVLKSLLFYRKNPLHFHFVSDKDATVVLQTLFDTWHIPSVSVSFYPTENLKVTPT